MGDLLLYHPELDRLDYWNDSEMPYTPECRKQHRSVWTLLETALELGWEVIGVI